MHSLLLSLLAFFARNIIAIKKPYIIGVTGTVGKSTITCWIIELLSREFGAQNVMSSSRHYNGEYGVPLTIIDIPSPGRNPFLWIWVFGIAVTRLFRPYPRYLILEYGVDHPCEMEFLLSIAIPDIGILAEVTPNHMEQFKTFDAYLHEKLLLINNAKHAVVHEKMRDSTTRDALYYGFGALSYIDASSIHTYPDHTDFSLHIDKRDYEVSLPLPGEHQIMNILPLFAVADILEIPTIRVIELIPNLTVGVGRGRVLEGMHGTSIIDGSYNGGYKSLSSGIDFMARFVDTHEVILFLGDMRELGDELTPHFHEAIAHQIITISKKGKPFHRIALVGAHMKKYVLPLLRPLYEEKVAHFVFSQDAGKWIRSFLETPHSLQRVVYVRGSQNTIYLEEGIKEILKNLEDASLLCRQTHQWMKIKKRFALDKERGL